MSAQRARLIIFLPAALLLGACGVEQEELHAQERLPSGSQDACAYPGLSTCGGVLLKDLPGYGLAPHQVLDADSFFSYSVEQPPDPQLYLEAVNQFGVESQCHLARYRPTGFGTFCNIFVWDVSRAVGSELPHWVYRTGHALEGMPVPPELGMKERLAAGRELSANRLIEWIIAHEGDAAYHGWLQVATLRQQVRTPAIRQALLAGDVLPASLVYRLYGTQASEASIAQQLADLGYPVVAAWHNDVDCDGVDEGSGHVAVVLPRPEDQPYEEADGPFIAQAGLMQVGVCSPHSKGNGTLAHGFFGLSRGQAPTGKLAGIDRAALLASVRYFIFLGPGSAALLDGSSAGWSCTKLKT
jgi:hypothetical protein